MVLSDSQPKSIEIVCVLKILVFYVVEDVLNRYFQNGVSQVGLSINSGVDSLQYSFEQIGNCADGEPLVVLHFY